MHVSVGFGEGLCPSHMVFWGHRPSNFLKMQVKHNIVFFAFWQAKRSINQELVHWHEQLVLVDTSFLGPARWKMAVPSQKVIT